ncbi:MAG: hypothetical protein MJ178_01360 [Treponemataceae bacterium]|nr:hypothetical protein [Treponemataceae bacterium]
MSAQNAGSAIQLLDEAEREFENGNLGIALKMAENAKEQRVSESTGYVTTLDTALTPLAVQNAGDLIPDVREILVSRLESRAVKIIDEALLLRDADYFNNSITEIKKYYINRSVYPEAEYLLGQIYQAEGEFDVARDFYFQALDHSYALDVPAEKIDIYYTTAYLAELMNDDNLYEVMLLNILDTNSWYTQGDGLSPYLEAAMDNALHQETATKFFRLYRANHPQSLNAAIQLSSFYYEKGLIDKAYACATVSALMTFTRLYEVLTNRKQLFEFKDLHQFFTAAIRYSDITEWMNTQRAWQGLYTFACICADKGNPALAGEIFSMLAEICTDSEIRKLSVIRL